MGSAAWAKPFTIRRPPQGERSVQDPEHISKKIAESADISSF